MPKEILIGTFNPNKVEEIQQMLGSDFVCYSCTKFPDIQDVEETGLTLEENAILKAKAYFEATGLVTIADDSGLEVEALHGAPGVFSARYAGLPSDSKKNKEKLLTELQGIPNRKAQFRTVIAYYDGMDVKLFEGMIKGNIGTEEKGSNGFGYDSLFIPENETISFAEMESSQKNKISHRAKAIQACIQFLTKHGK